MDKLNKELLARALVEGVIDSNDDYNYLSSSINHFSDGFHTTQLNKSTEYWKYVCTKEEYLAAKAEKEKPAQPVFTQAMADAGELPVVGMNCQGYVLAETKKQGRSCDKWVEGVFIQKSQAPNGGICFLFKCDNGHYYTLNSVSHFKPIDTRTEKEKAIDEILVAYPTFSEKALRGVLSLAYDKWVGK